MPKNGSVAEPGFSLIAPGSGVRADRRRRGVEDVDLVLVDDVPEP